MSLFNSMIKAAASNLINQNPELLGKAANMLCELLKHTEGVAGLVQKFETLGFEEIINSWMSEDERKPVSIQQLEQVIGKDYIDQLMTESELEKPFFDILLTKSLPKLVSFLTQKGQTAPQDVPALSADKAQELIQNFLS